jgi:hypothetical protein
MNFLTEAYQFLFISSTIFITYLFVDLVMKMIGRFVQNNENIRFEFSNSKKILFWISMAVFLSYLI